MYTDIHSMNPYRSPIFARFGALGKADSDDVVGFITHRVQWLAR